MARKWWIWGFGFLAICVLAATFVGMFAVKGIARKQIYNSMIVDSEQAQGYKAWAGEEAMDTYYELYVWNVENPKAAANGSEKIRVREVGPYTFREYRKRFNVEFSDDGNVVSYYQWQYYVFDQEKSKPGLSENDTFVTVNLAFQGIYSSPQFDLNISWLPSDKIRDMIVKGLVCQAWEKNMRPGYNDDELKYTPFVRVPVTAYFFGLKNEPIQVILKDWVTKIQSDSSVLFPLLNVKIPIPTADFPGLGVPNYTDQEDVIRRSNINIQYTGKNDTSLTGKYIKWENMTEVYVCPLPPPRPDGTEYFINCPSFETEWNETEANRNGWIRMWKTNEAMKISGSDTIQWSMLNSDSELLAFFDAIFRTAVVKSQWDSTQSLPEYFNVPAMKYSMLHEDLLNASENSKNDAFYAYGPSGLLNVSAKAGLPFFISKPHFLDADVRLIESVDGLSPDRAKHDSWFIKNDLVGVTIAAHQCVQLNAFIQDAILGSATCDIFGLDLLPCCKLEQDLQWNGTWKFKKSDSLGGVYVPMAHVLEHFVIREDQASDIKFAEFMYYSVPYYSPIIGFPLFALIMIIIFVLVRRNKRSKAEKKKSEDGGDYDLLSDEAEA